MPKNPEREGSPRLITPQQIEQEHGIKRSTLYTYRHRPSFPQPIKVEGSIKTFYRADEVAAWLAANPKQQGRRTDVLAKKKQQGEPVNDSAEEKNEPASGSDWRVPLKYTREDLAALLGKIQEGRHGRMSIADYPEGGNTYVIVGERGRSVRFNRLRVVDDPQYARDLAAVLLAWADREEAQDG